MTELTIASEYKFPKEITKQFVEKHIKCVEKIAPLREYGQEIKDETRIEIQKKAEMYGLCFNKLKNVSLFEKTALYEEASKHSLGLFNPALGALGNDLPSFLDQCTDKQKKRFNQLIAEKKGYFIAIWEETEDNDFDKLSAFAMRDGNGWIISGEKSYIQNVSGSGFGIVLVNCYFTNGKKKPTLFLLEDLEEIEIRKSLLLDVQSTYKIKFNNYRIDDQNRIGEIGEGSYLLKKWLAKSQILLASQCIGVALKALTYGQQFAEKRITRGRPLIQFESIRTMFAKSHIDIQSARLMTQAAAQKFDRQEEGWEIAAQIAKLHTTERISEIIDNMLQIHGGAGFAGDLPLERWYKEIRIARMTYLKSEAIIKNVAKSIL